VKLLHIFLQDSNEKKEGKQQDVDVATDNLGSSLIGTSGFFVVFIDPLLMHTPRVDNLAFQLGGEISWHLHLAGDW
jgi:hypothetical protein